ncbi:MAG TPA: hypothetical protein VNO55_12625 [Polyangia bacterium]|nr:hypothetical protein [Polyangia bacterium]
MNEDTADPSTNTGKAPYIKPEITQVPLRPQEAVLGFCKTSSATGGPGSPTDCTLCATSGS